MRARKLEKGGYGAELDVLAYDPPNLTLLHVETSGDAVSWAKRKQRFLDKKFIFSRGEYEDILGCKVSKIKKIAVVGYAVSPKADLNWEGDIEVFSIPAFMNRIADTLRSKHPMKDMVPEGFPILRAVQTVLAYVK